MPSLTIQHKLCTAVTISVRLFAAALVFLQPCPGAYAQSIQITKQPFTQPDASSAISRKDARSPVLPLAAPGLPFAAPGVTFTPSTISISPAGSTFTPYGLPFAPAVGTAKSWSIKPDDLSLANVFTRWGKEAGYKVLWDARKNIMIDGSDSLSGSFEEAVTTVLEGPDVASGPYPLEVCFYANTPPLARITRKGEQDKECK